MLLGQHLWMFSNQSIFPNLKGSKIYLEDFPIITAFIRLLRAVYKSSSINLTAFTVFMHFHHMQFLLLSLTYKTTCDTLMVVTTDSAMVSLHYFPPAQTFCQSEWVSAVQPPSQQLIVGRLYFITLRITIFPTYQFSFISIKRGLLLLLCKNFNVATSTSESSLSIACDLSRKNIIQSPVLTD